MGVSQSQIEVLLKLRAEGADTIDLFSGSVAKTGSAGVAAAEGLDRADDAIKRVSDDSVAAAVAVGAFAEGIGERLVHLGEDIVLTAARTQGLGAVADYLGVQTGRTRAEIDDLIGSIQRQGVTTQEANNLVIQLARNNLGLENATKLATVAQNAAFIAGESTAEAMQQIITGIVELQPRILKTAGLVVSFEQAESQLAHTLGTSAGALTEHQKQQAALNAVLQAGEPIAGVYALSMQYVGKQLTSLPRYEQEAENALGKQLLPILGAGVTAFTDLLKIITAHPVAFSTLGVAVTGVVGPLLLAKGAALLGIPTFAELGAAVVAAGTEFVATAAYSGSLAEGLNAMAATAGITTARLGVLGTAGAIAAAGFVGWQLGKVIGDLLGLDHTIDETVQHLDALRRARDAAANGSAGMTTATAQLADLQRQLNQAVQDGNIALAHKLQGDIQAIQTDQTRLAIQDTINRAIRDGAASNISYSEAIKYNTDVAAINIAKHNDSIAAQRASIQAQLDLGRITVESANAQLAALAAEEKTNQVRASRQKYTDVAVLAEKQFRNEIEATGYSETELRDLFQNDPVTFERWAKSVNLSEDSIKRLKDEVTAHKEAQKQAAEETKKYQAVLDDLTSAGEGWRGTLDGIDGAVVEGVKYYLSAGASLEHVASFYGLTATQVKAVQKALEDETKTEKDAQAQRDKFQKAMEDLTVAGDDWQATLDEMDGTVVEAVKGYLDAGVSQSALATAYGLTATQIRAVTKAVTDEKAAQTVTDQSIQQTQELWNDYFDSVSKATSTNTDYQIAQVQKWADDQVSKLKDNDDNWLDHYDAIQALAARKTNDIIAASDPLAVAWKGLNEDMRGDWAATWDQAFHGTTSFASAALKPFTDLRDGLSKIFAGILADFEAQFLNPMLGLAHQGIGWLLGQLGFGAGGGTSAFGGAGGSGGGLLNLGASFGLKSLGAGGAAAAGAVPFGTVVPASVYGSLPGTAASGTAAGLGAAVGGGAFAGMGGFLTGQLIGNHFGHTAGMIGGAAAGAGEGALIGSVVPGLGTAVGAIVGGAAGLIGGIFSGGKGRAADKDANKTLADTQSQLLQTYGSLQNIDLLGQQVGVDLADAWGDKGAKGLTNFQGLLTDFTAKVTTLQNAVQAYGLTWADITDPAKQKVAIGNQATALSSSYNALIGAGYDPTTVVKNMSGDLNQLVQVAEQSGQKLPKSLQPALDQLIRMGDITKENAALLLGLDPATTASFADITSAAGRYGLTLDQLGPKVNQLNIEQAAQTLSADWKTLTSDGEDAGAVMQAMKGKVQDVVTEAFKFGDQIPESMKPMIDQMIAAGLLTDDLGNKLTDDSKLSWEKPLTDDVEDLVSKMDELIDKLTGPNGVGAALDATGNRSYHPKISPEIEWPDGSTSSADDGGGGRSGGSGPDDSPRVGGAAQGIFASRPTLAIFGEGGEPEIGGPVSFMAKALAGALQHTGRETGATSGGGDIHFHLPAGMSADAFRAHGEVIVSAMTEIVRRGGAPRARLQSALGLR